MTTNVDIKVEGNNKDKKEIANEIMNKLNDQKQLYNR